MCLFWSSSCVLGLIAGLLEARRLAAGPDAGRQRTSQAARAPYKVAEKVWGGRGWQRAILAPPLAPWPVFCVWLMCKRRGRQKQFRRQPWTSGPHKQPVFEPASPIADKHRTLSNEPLRHPPRPRSRWLLKPCLSSSFKAYRLSFLGVWCRGWEAGQDPSAGLTTHVWSTLQPSCLSHPPSMFLRRRSQG